MMPCAWERSCVEDVMAGSACSSLSANPAIRKGHHHVLFDLSERRGSNVFVCFYTRIIWTNFKGRKGASFPSEAWIYRMNSPYKRYPVNCRRDLEWLPGWLFPKL